MTIDELIERLEDYRDELGGDTEIRLMTQQNWPFENDVVGLVSTEEIATADNEEDDFDPDNDEFVYIVEGRQIKYGDKAAWDAAR